MQKIISLFQRNYEGDRQVRDEVVPGAEWVAAGEGIATQKHDGTACLVRGGRLFKRYDVRGGKTPPPGWIPAEVDPNEHTGHWPGWLAVGTGPEDQYHLAALAVAGSLPDGTYELIGEKVQGNAEKIRGHMLVPHGTVVLDDAPRDFAGLKRYFEENPNIEGIVWHHPDGRMVKLKRRDFGLKWNGR